MWVEENSDLGLGLLLGLAWWGLELSRWLELGLSNLRADLEPHR